MQYGRRYSAEGGAGVTLGSAVRVWAWPKEPALGIEPAEPLSVRLDRFSIRAKEEYRRRHRAMLGSVTYTYATKIIIVSSML